MNYPHFFELSTSEYDAFVLVCLQSFTTKSPFGTAVAFICTSIYFLLVIYIFLTVITSKFHYFSVNSNYIQYGYTTIRNNLSYICASVTFWDLSGFA